jgi:hypothetical protein
MMAPPFRVHQEISRELVGALWEFLKGKPCKVYSAPFAVRFFPAEDLSDDTVYVLKNGEYSASAYGEGDRVPVAVLPGCLIELAAVFSPS